MSEPITVWRILSDGSHVHRDGTRCRLNHKKGRDWQPYVIIALMFFIAGAIVHAMYLTQN
jgi:hypothetical protein